MSIEADCPVLEQERAAVSQMEWRLHPGTEGLRVLKGRKWNFHFRVDSSICKSVSCSFRTVGASGYLGTSLSGVSQLTNMYADVLNMLTFLLEFLNSPESHFSPV